MTTARYGNLNRARQDEMWRALMRAAQGGDQLAYARLLHELTPVLRRVIRRKWRDPHEVEDLVQDVLLSLHTARHTYDPDHPFQPWLMTIARRRVADAARKAARRNAHEIVGSTLLETISMAAANIAQASREDAMALRQALVALAPGQREALELLKLRGLSLEEASAVSGKSIAALKSEMHRARRKLWLMFNGDA